jgi:hypothetical protein
MESLVIISAKADQEQYSQFTLRVSESWSSFNENLNTERIVPKMILAGLEAAPGWIPPF